MTIPEYYYREIFPLLPARTDGSMSGDLVPISPDLEETPTRLYGEYFFTIGGRIYCFVTAIRCVDTLFTVSVDIKETFKTRAGNYVPTVGSGMSDSGEQLDQLSVKDGVERMFERLRGGGGSSPTPGAR